MLTHEENQLLARVEGDAPMGRLMRQHWLPVCLSEEVEEPEGKPIRVRILGENLVAYRDSEGRVGLVGEFCPHRKASLVYGRNEEGGLRCLYHGWKVDADGNVVEMPSEPPEACAAAKFKHPAYPTEEAGGFVWAYMGDRATMPAFEPPPFAPTPETRVSIGTARVDCNWAQVVEGQIDSAHSSSLHSSDMVPARVGRASASAKGWTRPSTDKAPRLQVQLTSYGFRYAAIRRPIQNAAVNDYIRITTFVAPLICLIPPNASYNVAQVTIPIDDHSCMFHFMAWGEGPDVPSMAEWRKFLALTPGVDVDPAKGWARLRVRDNDYLQDRNLMKLGNFTGIKGIPAQDMAMWEGMGLIADRTSERLGASDVAIVQWRRLMIEAAKAFAEGAPALGRTEPVVPKKDIASFEGVVPKTTDWRTLGTSELERSLFPGAAPAQAAE
ncbi:Rieske 2Fe-2S domain-containing protein [Falsiroseomonas sp.]|jgi:phthalate 4,5-dioxygenase|uniref:Rieske 2Fe-2S domain-containing protein n=1 Tax=Falsiroseomonas sp. TaxID=2870721 RepID=UPI003F7047DA